MKTLLQLLLLMLLSTSYAHAQSCYYGDSYASCYNSNRNDIVYHSSGSKSRGEYTVYYSSGPERFSGHINRYHHEYRRPPKYKNRAGHHASRWSKHRHYEHRYDRNRFHY